MLAFFPKYKVCSIFLSSQHNISETSQMHIIMVIAIRIVAKQSSDDYHLVALAKLNRRENPRHLRDSQEERVLSLHGLEDSLIPGVLFSQGLVGDRKLNSVDPLEAKVKLVTLDQPSANNVQCCYFIQRQTVPETLFGQDGSKHSMKRMGSDN